MNSNRCITFRVMMTTTSKKKQTIVMFNDYSLIAIKKCIIKSNIDQIKTDKNVCTWPIQPCQWAFSMPFMLPQIIIVRFVLNHNKPVAWCTILVHAYCLFRLDMIRFPLQRFIFCSLLIAFYGHGMYVCMCTTKISK